MNCPNCVAPVSAARHYRNYHLCDRCGVHFLAGYTEKQINDYYISGNYRARHAQPQELKHQTRRARHIIQFIGNPKVFIDIGSSAGALMEMVHQESGATCYGVDIDPLLAKGVYQSINDVPEQADCITLIHTLEHMPRPLDTLREIHAKLNDGGRVVIEVPNGGVNERGEFYASAFNFPHVVMFDSYSLEWTLRAAGFDRIWSTLHGNGGLLDAPDYYYLLAIAHKN